MSTSRPATEPFVERRAPRPDAPATPRTRVRRVVSVLLWAVVAVGVLAYAATLLVPLWYQAQGERLLVVTSGSMAPRFVEGDVVVLRSVTDPSELKPNLIVTFQPVGGSGLVTHRIVSLHPIAAMEDDGTGRMRPVLDAAGNPVTLPYMRTQGDANPEPDPNATPVSRVRGVLLRVHHGWGDTLVWATSSAGRAVMLVPPLLALATLEVLSVLDGRRRRARVARPTAEDRRVDALLLD